MMSVRNRSRSRASPGLTAKLFYSEALRPQTLQPGDSRASRGSEDL